MSQVVYLKSTRVPSRSRKLHLISTQVPSETHPGLDFNSIHALSHLYQRPKTSCLTYMHVPTNHIPCPTYPIYLGCISPQSRSWYLCLISIYVTPHFHPGPQIHISIPHLQFKCWELPPASAQVTYHLHQDNVMLVSPTSIQFSWFLSHLH